MGTTNTDAIQELLANDKWLRSLARAMVRSGDVDDIIQETYAAALEKPPRKGAVRAWARSVVKRQAARMRRGEQRRKAREEVVAQPESTVGVDIQLATRQTEKKLTRAVLDLPEPHRSIVLMRFVDGLPPRKIAARLDMDPARVRDLLHRGLTRLRGDAATEDTKYWYGLLALAWPASRLFFSTTGWSRTLASLAAGVLILTAAAWPTGAPADAGDSTERVGTAPDGDADAPAATTAPIAERAPLRTPTLRWLRGRTLQTRGKIFTEPTHLAWADANGVTPIGHSDAGHFAVQVPTTKGRLVALDVHRVLRTTALPAGKADVENAIILVARRYRVRGKLRDEHGAPLDGATVTAVSSLRLPFPADHLVGERSPRTRTDENGEFELDAAIDPGVRFVFERSDRKQKYVVWKQLRFRGDEVFISATVWTKKPEHITRGVVRDLDGNPIAGALIESRPKGNRCRTDAAGRFEIPGSTGVLLVAKPGYGPALEKLKPGTEPAIVLDKAARVRGVLRHHDGSPAAGVEIRLENASLFRGDMAAESMPATTELFPSPWTTRFTTDERGRFRIGGLSKRKYVLRFFDPVDKTVFLTPPLEPGRRYGLRLHRPDRIPQVRSRVVTTRGTPVPNARVRLRTQIASRSADGKRHAVTEVETDANGWFEFRDVPRHHTRIEVTSPTTLPWNQDVKKIPATIELRRRCYIRFVGFQEFAPSIPDRTKYVYLRLLDANGKRVPLWVISGGTANQHSGWLINSGDHCLVTDERAVNLGLFFKGKEYSRNGIRVFPGELRVVTPKDVAPVTETR